MSKECVHSSVRCESKRELICGKRFETSKQGTSQDYYSENVRSMKGGSCVQKWEKFLSINSSRWLISPFLYYIACSQNRSLLQPKIDGSDYNRGSWIIIIVSPSSYCSASDDRNYEYRRIVCTYIYTSYAHVLI